MLSSLLSGRGEEELVRLTGGSRLCKWSKFRAASLARAWMGWSGCGAGSRAAGGRAGRVHLPVSKSPVFPFVEVEA